MVREVRQEKESEKRKSQRRERVSRKKIKVREKAEKSRITGFLLVCPMFCGSGGWKSRPAKAVSAEPCGEMGDHKMRPIVATDLEVKKLETPHIRNNLGS